MASTGAETHLAPTGSNGPVTALGERLNRARQGCIGFPVARDIDYSALLPLHHGLVNNVGDPEDPGRWPSHTLDVERAVVAFFVDLFGGNDRSSWGYVSGGGSSEGVLHGMWLSREHHPAARVYHSAAAHYCVPKAARLLRIDASVVAADPAGAVDLDDLGRALHAYRDRPAIVVVTLGTTMTEALDDLAGVHTVLDEAGVPGRHVVVDAALSGPALALDGGPAAGLLAGDGPGSADSVCFSSHKSFGTPHVGGVVLTHRRHVARISHRVDYVASNDLTVGGSRSGQSAVELGHALDVLGTSGLRERARTARRTAEHAIAALRTAGWRAWRNPHAWTVVLDPPPPQPVILRWGIPVGDGCAHLVCVPGVGPDLVDAFVADLSNSTDTHEPGARAGASTEESS